MNKEDFIDCLISMYPKTFENNADMWRSVYEQALPVDINFDDLFDWFLVNYNSANVAPGAGVFKPYLDKFAQDKQEKARQTQQREAQEGWKQLQKEIASVESEPIEYDLLEPLDLLKTHYTEPKAFVLSMQKRQETLPKFMKHGFIFFLNEEMREFRNYVNKLPHEKLKIMFWRKVARLIGSEDKYNELCRNL